ncbi:MAG: FdtA/QdtA family cupin domain-containing protein [Ferruginibacter sp.]
MFKKPHIIEYPKIGNSQLGYISVAENQALPFEVRRIYWTYYTPESVERGRHAHYNLEQILIAISGKIIVTTEIPGGETDRFILESPNVGLYLPKFCWHTMKYSHNSTQMCIANMAYDEEDYIRDYEKFKVLK